MTMQIWIFIFAIFYLFQSVDTAVQCEQKNVTVQLPVSSPNISCSTYSIATWLCWKRGTQLQATKVIHLTIHGFTYDHTYWSFPYQSTKYSYIDYIIEKSNGRIAVLNIDRLGIGLSSKPQLETDVTIDSNAYVIYDLTKKLYEKAFRNIKFKNIVLVGHSLGTIISWRVASDPVYNQYIKGLIATGFFHALSPIGLADFLASFYPVQLDPKFSQQSLPLGYITTNPFNSTRRLLFYKTNDADSNVINLDEQLKQTGTASEISTTAAVLQPNVTQMIPKRIPVFAVIGQYDHIMCDASNANLSCDDAAAIIRREQPSYSYPIEAYVLSKSGHCINLHLNAQDWYEQALKWTRRYF